MSTSNNRWETTRRLGRECLGCGKLSNCTMSPDHAASKCWSNGGKLFFANGGRSGGGFDTGYVGKAHRRDNGATRAKTYPTADEAIAAAGRQIEDATLAGRWTYHDSDGESERLIVARFDTPDGGKEFRPVARHKGKWKLGDPAGPLPLYRLADLRDGQDPVFVCEGEKAADAAASLDLTATTSAHGSSAAGKSDWSPLAGREVVILPDADQPGESYARDVTRILLRLDPPARVKILRLPGLPPGGDVVEFVASRGTETPDSIGCAIVLLAHETPSLDPVDFIGGPVLVCAADVKCRPIEWLWPGRVALGRITLVSGKPGEGKSFLASAMAACVTTGTQWPDGAPCDPGAVIMVSGEDDPADTTVPRLIAHGADVRKVNLLSSVRVVADDGESREVMFGLSDVASLEAALTRIPNCRLVTIDPIGSFIGGRTDMNKDNEVRSVLAPVAALAARHNVAVVVVAHRRKGGGGGGADESTIGSRAFTGIARAVWHLTRDKNDKDRRLLLSGKNNLGREGPGLAFRVVGEGVGRIEWERDPVYMSADEALANEQDDERSPPGPKPKERVEAAAWLRGALLNGPVPVGGIESPLPGTLRHEAAVASHSWGTVERASREIGVVKRPDAGLRGAYVWELPPDPPPRVVASPLTAAADDGDHI